MGTTDGCTSSEALLDRFADISKRTASHELPEDLRSLVRQVEQALEQLKLGLAEILSHAESQSSTATGPTRIRQLIKARRARDNHFAPELFADPAWDILLELFVAYATQQPISVSGLAASAGVPATTALRWICKLEHEGWLARISDPLDGRRTWIEISPAGIQSMQRYFEHVASTLPAI